MSLRVHLLSPMAVIAAFCVVAAVSACGVVGLGAGRTFSYHGYGGTAIVSADGRTITVGEFPGSACGAKITAVAEETRSRVALFLRYPTPHGQTACVSDSAAKVIAQNIRLGAPLERRKLVDGATGRATEWISARLVLHPGWLPDGFRLQALIPAADISGVQVPGPAGCVQIFTSGSSPFPLEIVQSAAPLRGFGSSPSGWTTMQVRDHHGLATRNVITWRENGLVDYVSAGGAAARNSPQLLSTQQLIAIADSAP